jgi:putative hydroxymethylpyrimidine transport system substrate-binding protein
MGFVAPSYANKTHSPQKITVILDWFVNPDHAPLIVAQQQGFFSKKGLNVELIAPANASDPPKLVAVGKADIGIDYQPHLLTEKANGLPLVQIGSLVDQPLTSFAVLASSSIQSLADIKGKRVAYSHGINSIMLETMLQHTGLTTKDIEQVSVGYGLMQALLSKKVDAVMGLMRNIEPIQMEKLGQPVRQFYPEANGFPSYDELVFIVQKQNSNATFIKPFLTAVAEGAQYLQQYPEESWKKFIVDHPELNDELNHEAWNQSLKYFAKDPAKQDLVRCIKLAEVLKLNKEVCG